MNVRLYLSESTESADSVFGTSSARMASMSNSVVHTVETAYC